MQAARQHRHQSGANDHSLVAPTIRRVTGFTGETIKVESGSNPKPLATEAESAFGATTTP
jgi:hypothetical protein